MALVAVHVSENHLCEGKRVTAVVVSRRNVVSSSLMIDFDERPVSPKRIVSELARVTIFAFELEHPRNKERDCSLYLDQADKAPKSCEGEAVGGGRSGPRAVGC